MFVHWKSLLITMAIALAVFAMARPFCVPMMGEAAFKRRRSVWFVLTVTSFLSPSYWGYVAVALPLLFWAASKDENPPALFVLLLYVVTPGGLEIPIAGVNRLFEFTTHRLLALAILLPYTFRAMSGRSGGERRSDPQGLLILLYMVVLLATQIQIETATNTLRRGILFVLDTYIIYHVFSRVENSERAVGDVLASLALACAVMAPVAVFENLRHWLLYADVASGWGTGVPSYFSYLLRGESLRAQASTGHALTLGYLLAMAFGSVLYLQRLQRLTFGRSFVIGAWMWAGLFAAISRGPWLVGGLVFLVFTVLSPGAGSRLARAAIIGVIVGAAVLVTPYGSKVIDLLPFVGTVDSFNVTYRERLFDTSVELIKVHPWFGDPFVLNNMEDLRQGEGIIDLMNGYLQVALFTGLVGVLLFMAPLLISLCQAFAKWRAVRHLDHDMAVLGATLMACLMGTFLFIATATYGPLTYVFAGLLAVYARIPLRYASTAPSDLPHAAPSPLYGRPTHPRPFRG